MKKIKCLIAEDDVSSRALLQAFLSRYGECHLAEDGKTAVELARRAREDRESFDLICMDLRMPIMEGHEAIREIRKHEAASGALRPAKIIVTTAHSDLASITSALLARCNSYLVKPIDTVKLMAELQTLGLVD
jgi:two-component system chemotaxis response regulator CheY